MKPSLIAVTIALAFGTSAFAAQERMSEDAREAAEKRIEQQHEAAKEKCETLQGDAKDICEAEADGQKKVAEAELKVRNEDTPENRRRLAVAKAEAAYEVEKERCEGQEGKARSACINAAQAERDRELARAQTMTRERPSATGSGR